jgi:hypothetical protein
MSSPYQVPTPSAPPPKSNAALIIVLVFVGVVVVLGATAFVVLPKMLHLHADGSQPAATSGSTAVPAGAASDGPSPASTSSGTSANSPSTATSNGVSPTAATSAKVGRAPKRGNVGRGAAGYGQAPADAKRDIGDSSQRAAEEQELDRLTHQYNLLEARVASFDASMNTMREAQEQQGVNMRGDMATAQNRLHGNMERMQSALEQKDLDSANRYLELCDRDAAKLADFLGQ